MLLSRVISELKKVIYLESLTYSYNNTNLVCGFKVFMLSIINRILLWFNPNKKKKILSCDLWYIIYVLHILYHLWLHEYEINMYVTHFNSVYLGKPKCNLIYYSLLFVTN